MRAGQTVRCQGCGNPTKIQTLTTRVACQRCGGIIYEPPPDEPLPGFY